MTETQQPDTTKKQLWVIIGLAILVIALTLVWYFGIALPGHEAALKAPQNFDPWVRNNK